MKCTLEEARAAKDKAKKLFTGNVGVGITQVDDGYAVKVNLKQPMDDQQKVPKSIDGILVQFEVVGEIRKQQP